MRPIVLALALAAIVGVLPVSPTAAASASATSCNLRGSWVANNAETAPVRRSDQPDDDGNHDHERSAVGDVQQRTIHVRVDRAPPEGCQGRRVDQAGARHPDEGAVHDGTRATSARPRQLQDHLHQHRDHDVERRHGPGAAAERREPVTAHVTRVLVHAERAAPARACRCQRRDADAAPRPRLAHRSKAEPSRSEGGSLGTVGSRLRDSRDQAIRASGSPNLRKIRTARPSRRSRRCRSRRPRAWRRGRASGSMSPQSGTSMPAPE